jgi:hypothetical protein
MKYLLYYCFLFLIIIFFAYINSRSKEPFTSVITGFYRPIIRNGRLAAEGIYNKTTDHVNKTNRNINNFFARIRIS